MPRMQITMPDRFLEKLSRLGRHTDDVIGKVLEAGAEPLYEKAKANLISDIGVNTAYKSRSTKELQNSLGISPVQVDRKGRHNIKIGFNEPRKKQYAAKSRRTYGEITNAMIANVIEYGKSGQPARAFMKPAISSTKIAREAAMEAALEKALEEL